MENNEKDIKIKGESSHFGCDFDAQNNILIVDGRFCGFNANICIPEGVKRIAPGSLAQLDGIQSLTLPSTLEEFDPDCLREPYDTNNEQIPIWLNGSNPSRLRRIDISEENTRYKSVNGFLLSKDGKKLVYMPTSLHSDVCIPEGVEEILEGSMCFVRAKEVVFPKTLRRIDKNACCKSTLEGLSIPACEIFEGAFRGSVVPKYLELNNEIIPEYAFAFCDEIKCLVIGENVKLIKSKSFYNTKIEKVYVSSRTKIEKDAFAHILYKWSTINNSREAYNETPSQLTICAEKGSLAESFAKENGIKFEAVDNIGDAIKDLLENKKQENAQTSNSGDLYF